MKILIQKFGGTSVATEEKRNLVIDKIINAKNGGFSPVVVVSAMGRFNEPYATDTLINIVKSINPDIEKRELDMLMSCGEIISSVVLCAGLQFRGYKSVSLTGFQSGIITDSNFGNASIIRIDNGLLDDLINNGIIPVVAGFQGITEKSEITTIGRGGSDTTAAALGEALKAYEIDIYTDVDGIMTADPKIVPDAKLIQNMDYNEVFQFADMGAKVINPKAVEFAMRGNIPIAVKNTFTDAPGTLIAGYCENDEKRNIVTGIASMVGRTQIYIDNINGLEFDDEFLFTALSKNNISIDLINVFPEHKIFTIDSIYTNKVEILLNEIKVKHKVITNCSKISVIGSGIRGVPGVMARIIRTLKRNNVKILQTSDSYTTIWCLIDEKDLSKAVCALHNEFILSK